MEFVPATNIDPRRTSKPPKMETKKKQRPYSDYEKQLILQLVQSKVAVIENRRTDGVSQRKKMEAWQEITAQFNNSNVTQIADPKQLKKMWQNLKTKARDAKTLEAQRKRTGGGPAPPDMGPLESQVIAVMPNVLPSIDVEIDSDTLTVDGTLGLDNDEQSWLPKKARISDVEDKIQIEILNEPHLIEKPASESSSKSAIPLDHIKDTKKETKEKKRKSFDELKQELILQEIEQNKKRFDEEMRREREKYMDEKEFLKKKRTLELEILEIKKENILKNKTINE